MPLYEYKCQRCGELLQDLRSIRSRDDPTNCGKCRAVAKRVLSTFNILGKVTNKHVIRNSPERNSGGAGIRIGGQGNIVESCTFENLRTGISIATGTAVKLRNNKFKNVRNPVEVR